MQPTSRSGPIKHLLVPDVLVHSPTCASIYNLCLAIYTKEIVAQFADEKYSYTSPHPKARRDYVIRSLDAIQSSSPPFMSRIMRTIFGLPLQPLPSSTTKPQLTSW